MFCLEPVGKRPKGAAPYASLVPRGEDRPYYVGRVEETCAIYIDHHDVSRKHASLEVTTFQSFLNQNPGARQYFTLWRESRAQDRAQDLEERRLNGGDDEFDDDDDDGLDSLVEELLLSPLLRIRNLSRFGTKIQVIPDFHSDVPGAGDSEADGGARSFVLRDSEGEHVAENDDDNKHQDAFEHGAGDGVEARYVYIPSATHDQYIISCGQSAHFKVSFRPIVASIATLHYTPEYVFELTHMFRQLGCTVLVGGIPQPHVTRINYAEVFLRVNEDEELVVALHQEAAAVSAAAVAVSMVGLAVKDPSESPDRNDNQHQHHGGGGASPAPHNNQHHHHDSMATGGLPSSSPIRQESRGRSTTADGLVDDFGGPSLRDLAGTPAPFENEENSDIGKERARLERAHARREVQSRVTLQTKMVEFFADQLSEVLLKPLAYIHVGDEIDDSIPTLHALAIGYMNALPAYVFELFALVAENPTRPLHALPHPSVGTGGASAEPLRKRAVYGSAPYVHPVPTSCPLSLHPIPQSSTAPRSRRELFAGRSFFLPTVPLQRKDGAAVALCGGRVVTYTEPPSAKANTKARLEAAHLAEQQQLLEAEEARKKLQRDQDDADMDSNTTRSSYNNNFDSTNPARAVVPAPVVPAAAQKALLLSNNSIIDVDEDGELPLGALFVGKYAVVSEVLEQQVKDLYLYAQDAYAQYQRYPLATILNSSEALSQVIYEPSVVAELKEVLLAVHRGWMPVTERSIHTSLLSNAFCLHNHVVEEIVIMAVEEQQQLGLHIKGMEASGADMVQNEIESQRRRDLLVRVFGSALADDNTTLRDTLLQEHNDALFAQLSQDKARKYGALAEEVMMAAPNRLGGGLMRSTGNRNSNLRVLDEHNAALLAGVVAANRHSDSYESVFNPDGRLVRRSNPVVDRLEGGGGGGNNNNNTISMGSKNTPGAYPAEDVRKGIPLGLLKGRLNPFHRNKHYDPLLDEQRTATSKHLGGSESNRPQQQDQYEVDSDATPSSVDSEEHNLNHKKVPEGRFTRELKIYDEAREYKRLVLLAFKNSSEVLTRESSKLRALHANVLASVQREDVQRQHYSMSHTKAPSSGKPTTLSGQSVSWLHSLLSQHCSPQLELLERLALYKESRNPTINDNIEGELLLGPSGGVSSPHRRAAHLKGGSDANLSSWIAGERRENGSVPLLETLWDEAEEIRILAEACLAQHAREVGQVTTDGGYVPPLRYESEFARQVEEILSGEAALGIQSLDMSKTQSSMRREGRSMANLKSPRRAASSSSKAINSIARKTATATAANKRKKQQSGAVDAADNMSDLHTAVGGSKYPNVPSTGISVDGNRKFALLSSHLADVEHSRRIPNNQQQNQDVSGGSLNQNASSPSRAGPEEKRTVARGTALARYPPLPLFVTQEMHRNPRLASAALTSPHTVGTVATGGIRRNGGGPTSQQYMGRDPTTAHLSAAEALTAKLCEAVPPSDLKGVARRRGHFLKKYGRDEGEKRFTLWLGGQTPIWNREFYRSLDRANLTLHGLFERGW